MFNSSFLFDYRRPHCEDVALSHFLQSLRKPPLRTFSTSKYQFSTYKRLDFPGDTVVKNLPTYAGGSRDVS